MAHKADGEENVVNKRCIYKGCFKNPTFGTERKKPVHCADHKIEGEHNVKHAPCAEHGCDKIPVFGTEWKKPKHCGVHKTDDEKNVVHERCAYYGCEKRPSFGNDRGKPIHCKYHVTDGEIDVVNKRCIEPYCDKQPSFGAKWMKPLHCTDHRGDDELDVVHARCVWPGCDKHPIFGTSRMKPHHCTEHKMDDEQDVVNKRCIGRDGLPCPTRERAYFGAHCRYCAEDDEVKVVRKKTEARCIKRILQLLGPLVTAQEQLHVPFKCGDFEGTCAYLDVVLDHPRIRIVLEIDECQHFTIAAECERRRMETVTGQLRLRSADARPIAWVRFNPDDGKDPACAAAQRRRCTEAAKAIRELIESPRDGVVFVNYM